MKKVVALSALALVMLGAMALFSACDKDFDFRNWDAHSFSIRVGAYDTEGNYLLDPLREDNICAREMTVTYRGKTYHLGDDQGDIRGLHWGQTFYVAPGASSFTTRYCLAIGSFSSMEDFKDEELVLSWGDGTQDVIQFTNIYDEFINYNRSVKLNGKEVARDELYFDKVLEKSDGEIVYRPWALKFYYSFFSGDKVVVTHDGVDYDTSKPKEQQEFLLKQDRLGLYYLGFKEIGVDEELVNEEYILSLPYDRKYKLVLNNYKDEHGKLIRNVSINGKMLGTLDEIDIYKHAYDVKPL